MEPNTLASRPRVRVTGSLIFLMLFVILMSVFFFLPQSLRLDEAQSLWQTSRSPLKILNVIAQDVHVPFYHMLLHFWRLYFGSSVVTARVLSLVFFVLSVPAIYFLGKRAYGKQEGLFAALLLSISPFMNWYGNEIRMYSLFTFLTIVSHYFFLRIYQRRGDTGRTDWILYGIVSVLGIFTHYFFFFNLATQGLFYLFNKKSFASGDMKRFVTVAVLLAVAFLPWVIYVLTLGTISNSSPQLASPTTINIFNTFSQFLFGFQTDYVNTIIISLWPLVVLFAFLGLRKRRSVLGETLYFSTALIVPIVLAFVISILIRPLYLSRYLILSLPPLYLILANFTSSFEPKARRILRFTLVIVMLAMLVIESVSAVTPVKENYHLATEYLEAHAIPSDVIVVSAPFTVYPIEYYYQGPTAITTLPTWNRLEYGAIPAFDPKTLPQQVDQIKNGHDNIWLLLSYDQGYEEQVRMYFDTHFERLDVQNFSPGMNLYKYRVRY